MSLWDYSNAVQFPYGDDVTYIKGMEWLNGCAVVEDWGCGTAFAEQFCTGSYRGVDGAPSKYTWKVADLRTYTSKVPGIFMRHVLEHNIEWELILRNALESFTQRMCLIIFTPFGVVTHDLSDAVIPDLSFAEGDLHPLLDPYLVGYDDLSTGTQYGVERIYYLEQG